MQYTIFYRNRMIVECGIGTPESLSKDDYKEVCTLEVDDLEDVFRELNIGRTPRKYGIRSLSHGDVVVDGDGKVHFCATFGWGETKWE